jgi:hypothetical protein
MTLDLLNLQFTIVLYEAMRKSDNQTSDEEWAHDQIKNVVPELKKTYDEANKTNSPSEHHKRDAGDKPRPKPGDADYYTDPSFFPYPMPPTPVIADELKNSFGNAYNKWQANSTGDNHSNCSWGREECNKADAITTKMDFTPKDERKMMVEACINSLIADPSCFGK